jgi:uncharacterized membrane protein YeaQ/YmgE (transglycosylase-associated protein family)
MGLPEKQETIEGYTMGNMDTRSILIFLGIGLLAGFLAGLVVGGGNILMFLVWGVLGSFVGGFLFSALKVNLGIRSPIVSQIVTSTVGAIVVVIVARLIGG